MNRKNQQGVPTGALQDNPELRLSHLQRMELAEARAQELHQFLNMNDVVGAHGQSIQHLLVEEKYQKNLVCMFSSHSPVTEPWAPKLGCLFATGKSASADYLDTIANKIRNGYTISNIFTGNGDSSKKTRTFMYIPRNVVEYNFMFVQLCVVLIVEDDNGSVLLLKNRPDSQGRIKDNVSFVQGHVEVDNDINFTEALYYLQREAIRELNEEVSGLNFYREHYLDFKGLFYDNRTQVSSEHISAVFKLTVNDLSNVKTSEPDKHDVLIVKKSELGKVSGIDNLVQYVSKKRL